MLVPGYLSRTCRADEFTCPWLSHPTAISTAFYTDVLVRGRVGMNRQASLESLELGALNSVGVLGLQHNIDTNRLCVPGSEWI